MNWQLDNDAVEVSQAAKAMVGHEMVDLIQRMQEQGGTEGVIQFEAVEGLPKCRFRMTLLDGTGRGTARLPHAHATY